MAEKIIVQNFDNLTQGTGQWEFSASGLLTDGGSGIPITATAVSASFLNNTQWRNALVQAFVAKALSEHGVVVDQVVICNFTIDTV